MDDDQVAKPAEEVEEGGEKKDEVQVPAEEGADVDAGGVTPAPAQDDSAADEGKKEEEEETATEETPAVE